MKHLVKDIYIDKPDKYNFEIVRKYHPQDKKGNPAEDGDGNLKIAYSTLGYYSGWQGVWGKIKDLGMEEWINGDVNACRVFIEKASANLKEYFDDVRTNS